MNTYKVGFVGCGARSIAYAEFYAKSDDVRIAGISDPLPRQRAVLKRECALSENVPEYDDWRELLEKHPDLNGVVISSPTQYHVDQAIACFERGLPVALEKPLATNKAECERLLTAQRTLNGRSLIGFVLRSTPYFSKVCQLVSEGRVGRILSIQADELPGWFVTSVMCRSPWRRYVALSGGAMLEKSCHDMDMLNWLMGSRPVAIHSFGNRLVFNPNPELPESCPGCRVADTCKYHQSPKVTHEEGEGIYAFQREDLRCIYNIDKDIMDTQSVSLEYENGAIASFMLSFHTAGQRAGRNIHIIGTRGRIWGNMELNEASLFDNQTEHVEEFPIETDGTGHGGGDRRHAFILRDMMADPAFRPEQEAQAGYLSAVMCFAADQSVAERRRITFRYCDNGYIELV